MNKNTITLIIGPSGSGKNYRVNSVYAECTHIEPIAPWRRFLENTFGRDEGSLDEQETKSCFVPGSPSTTFGEYMLKMYHAHRECGVSISEHMLQQQLSSWYYSDLENPLVVTGVRTVGEAKVLTEFASHYKIDIQLEILFNRGELKTSDLELLNIIGHLYHDDAVISGEFVNNGETVND